MGNYAIITSHARPIHDLGAPWTSLAAPRGAQIMNGPRWGVIFYQNSSQRVFKLNWAPEIPGDGDESDVNVYIDYNDEEIDEMTRSARAAFEEEISRRRQPFMRFYRVTHHVVS